MKKRWNYSWVIVAICFLSVAISLGFCSSGRTMYLTAITDALKIPRSAFSLTETFRFCTTTVLNMFFGSLIAKFGPKKLLSAGFMCLVGFAVVSANAETLWGFYAAAILLGIGLSWTGTTMMGTVVNVWCTENKGAITGAILCANGLGGAISAQILSPIIFKEGDPFGYRSSYWLVAAILSVMLVFILIFFKDRPKGSEGAITVKKKGARRGTGWTGMDYREAIRKPYFYLALAAMTLTGMSLQGLAGIATPHMYDLGLNKDFVALVMTFSSIALMGSKFFIGFLCDRWGVRRVTNVCLVCSFLSLIGLVALTNTPLGRGIAFGRVIFYAIAMPLETVMLPLLASELFGDKSFAKILGFFSAASSAGFALGAPFANLCYDLFGSYNLPFVVFALLMVFVTVSLQIVFKKASCDRAALEAIAKE